MPPAKTVFDVKHRDEWMRVSIEEESATFVVLGIDDVGIVIEALNRAVAAGTKRGTLFTGEIVDDHMAAMHTVRASKGITWLGGKVSFLGRLSNGPQFRIDWDVLPTVTE
jgi:hypothetical protein